MSIARDAASPFDADRILAETFVRGVERHSELGSTNDRALELAADESLETPLLVIAERQTGGRGRGANRWWSAPGGLTFSLVLSVDRWRCAPNRQPLIALTTGLAVCETVCALRQSPPGIVVPPWTPGGGCTTVDVQLKWPNDVLLAGRKLCGILVEARGASPHVVIGIGLNVNNSLRSAPVDVQQRAISLVDAHRHEYDLDDVLIRVLQHLEATLPLLGDTEERLAEQWREYCALTGRIVQVEMAGTQVAGRCAGIDRDGALLLQTERGAERILSGIVLSYE